MGSQRGRHDWAPFTHSITQCLMNATDSLKLVELSDLCSGMLTSFLRKMLVIWLKEINKKNELRELFFDVLLFPDWRRQWQPTPELLPGKSHGWRSLVGCSPWGSKESNATEQLHFHFSLSCIGEGNGNPLQCSCLENPRDGRAWWAAVYGVTQNRTWLKRLNSS